MRKKFTRKMKTEITKQWQEQFPSMGIYENMWLINLLGPIVVGLLLEVKSGNDMYYPALHLDILGKEDDEDVSLFIKITDGFQSISNISPPDKYIKLANMLKAKAIFPLEGDVKLQTIIDSLKKYTKNKGYDRDLHGALIILGYLSKWTGDEAVMKDSCNFINSWKEQLSLNEKDYIDEWYSILFNKSMSSRDLQLEVDRQIVELKLDHLPRRKILF